MYNQQLEQGLILLPHHLASAEWCYVHEQQQFCQHDGVALARQSRQREQNVACWPLGEDAAPSVIHNIP